MSITPGEVRKYKAVINEVKNEGYQVDDVMVAPEQPDRGGVNGDGGEGRGGGIGEGGRGTDGGEGRGVDGEGSREGVRREAAIAGDSIDGGEGSVDEGGGMGGDGGSSAVYPAEEDAWFPEGEAVTGEGVLDHRDNNDKILWDNNNNNNNNS